MQKIIVSLIVTLLLVGSIKNYFANQSLSVYFFDVGQGDASLVITPDNKYMLIDGGPNSSVLEKLGATLPFWVKSIDVVIATHPDADHIAGLKGVLSNYSVEKYIQPAYFGNSSLSKSVAEDLTTKGIDTVVADSDSDFMLGCCVLIDFIWPIEEGTMPGYSSNDHSLTFTLHYQQFSAYFGGDLSTDYEIRAIQSAGIDGSQVDVAKVSHHGSKTSTGDRVVELLSPKYAVISCGLDNKFGHPHEQVLAALAKYNVEVLRTDHSGDILLVVSGDVFWFG